MPNRNSGYAAMPHSKYYTPGWTVTRDLASLWTPPRNCAFWEPCAGRGNLARAITRAWGNPCLATDLEPDAHQLVPIAKLDFLRSSGPSSAAHCPLVIITNFPYGTQGKLGEQCLRHALAVTERSGGVVIALFPFGFDAARGRRSLVGEHPAFAAKRVTSQRIRWTNLAQKDNGPSGDHAWFIWEWTARRRNAWALKQLGVAG